MLIRVLLPALLTLLAITAAPGTLLAQSTALDESEPEVRDEDLESLYADENDPGDIEVITVRAERSESAGDFESNDSVAVFDASDLEAIGAQNIADLATFTPNLEIVTSGATSPTFFIRGVGLNVFNANSSGAVAIYQNDVPKNSPALQLGTLFDIESVNVLRGPQGGGTYRSASAGAIKIYSRKPTGNYNAYLRSSYGNYNAVDLEGAVGGPIVEDILAGRIAFRFSDRDGYVKNGCGDATPQEDREARPAQKGIGSSPVDPRWSQCGEDIPIAGTKQSDGTSFVPDDLPTRVNNRHNWAARGTLLFQPTLDQEWLLTASGGERDELSRLGQSIGADRAKLFDSFLGPLGSSGTGLLGVTDGSGSYTPDEVDQRLREFDPCISNKNGSNKCFLADGVTRDKNKANYTRNAAKRLLSRDLARNLDPKPHTGDFNRVDPTELETWGVSLKGDIVLADSVELTTITGYDHYDRLVGLDLDQSPNILFETTTKDDGWQFAQSVEVDGGIGRDTPVTWHFGTLFLYEELNVAAQNAFPGSIISIAAVSDRQYQQKLWSGTANAGFTINFWEKFALDAGLRYNWERKSIDYLLLRGSQFDFPLFSHKTWQAPTGSIRLTYNFTEIAYAYWKYTRGWKGGHFNATGGDDGVTHADPESIDAFEVGLHGAWFKGALGLDLSFFHYNYQDYQLFTAQQDFGSPPEFAVINAPNSEVYGSELDLLLRPRFIEGMMLRARLAWLQSQFIDYTKVQVERLEVSTGNK
ncbi:MAG: TonB-dependent receptor, partial [Deltaproteobacteria bacterium]|nr:TonB-dependent receptor [Deltaproteobacteria bacterium]